MNPPGEFPTVSAGAATSSSEKLSDEPSWFLIVDRKKEGPVPLAGLKQKVMQGSLKPSDMLLQQGETRWQPAGSIPGLFPDTPAQSERQAGEPESIPNPGAEGELADQDAGLAATTDTVEFEDSSQTYKRVAQAVKSNKAVLVNTPYSNVNQVPPAFKKAFGLTPAVTQQIANPATGQFIPGTTAQGTLNLDRYLILLCTGAGFVGGAGVGALGGGAGALPGALLGGLLGLGAGLAQTAMNNQAHCVTFHVPLLTGKLSVQIQPLKANTP